MALKGIKVRDSRSRAIVRIGNFLVRRGIPRVQMTMMVAATGLAGFLFSAGMLHLGVHSLWLRYPLAVLFAYGVFLLLLRLWIYYWHRRLYHREPSSGSGTDTVPDDLPVDLNLPLGISSASPAGAAPDVSGFAGGDSGGGGAEVSLGEGEASSGGILNSLSGAADFDLDCDELIVIIVVAAAVLAAVLSAVYVIVIAPTFLAEILLDGVLVSGLYRHLKKVEQHSWLESAIRRTWIPVTVTVCIFLILGFAFHAYAPEAKSIGEVWKHYQQTNTLHSTGT